MSGRPRRPYCPDCRKADPTSQTRKEKGGGYCADHRKLRQLAYKAAYAEEETDSRSGEEVVVDYIRKRNLKLEDEVRTQAQVIGVLERSNQALMMDADAGLRREMRKQVVAARSRAYDFQEILHDRFPDEFCHPRDNTDD